MSPVVEDGHYGWKVSLDVIGDAEIRHEWVYDTGWANESPTEAIDSAIKVCDEEIVGLNYVRKWVSDND